MNSVLEEHWIREQPICGWGQPADSRRDEQDMVMSMVSMGLGHEETWRLGASREALGFGALGLHKGQPIGHPMGAWASQRGWATLATLMRAMGQPRTSPPKCMIKTMPHRQVKANILHQARSLSWVYLLIFDWFQTADLKHLMLYRQRMGWSLGW